MTWESQARDLAEALPGDTNKADFSRAKYQEKLAHLRRDIDSNTDDSLLPAYQMRKRQETLKSLEDQLKALQPPAQSRFSFKKQASQLLSEKAAVCDIESGSQDHPPQYAQVPQTRQKHIIHSSSTTSASALFRQNLSRCLLDLRAGPVPSLYLKDLEDTVVVAPDVQGSVLVHNAKNCLFAINCHQFRIHTSSSTKIIINAKSAPVIEDCHSLSFAFLSPDGSPKAVDQGNAVVEDFDSPTRQAANKEATWTYLDTEQARQKYILLANLPADELGAEQVDQIVTFLLSS